MLSEAEGRAECQRYLATFRVLELKELLRAVGCSQKGRKPELFQKANELLRHGSPKIQNKIREIHSKSTNIRKALQFSKISAPHSPSKSVIPPQRAYIVHPDVKFKAHPFFFKIDSIIRPTALISSSKTSSGSFTMRLQFYMTPQQVQQVFMSKNAQGSFQTQVLLRFCRQETSCEQEDFYPKYCYVKVNDQYCPLPGYHPHLSTRPDYRRNGSPVNVTNCVKTSAVEVNNITIYWGHDIMYPQGFCVSIELARNLSPSDLLQCLKSKGLRSPDVSRALVREKLSIDRDSEIAATSLRVSLLCPLGKMRMQHPCRAISCSHLQCFDASIYLQMNEKKARWICPVCDRPAPISDLVVDGLYMEICEKSPSNDVVFSSDGSWHPISDKEGTTLSVITPDKRSTPVMVDTPTPESKGGSDPVVIDLTGSSDEEEDDDSGPPSQRSRTCHRQISTDSASSSTSEVLYLPRCSSSADQQSPEYLRHAPASQARPMPVITQGHGGAGPSYSHQRQQLAPYHLHQELYPCSSEGRGTPLDDVFNLLDDNNIFTFLNSPSIPSPTNPGIISLD